MYDLSVLDNGLKVITRNMPHSNSVSMAYLIGTGSCYEKQDEKGISHFIEHMCFKGTNDRPTSMHITREIEGIGGIINASTDKESTIFWSKVASKHFPIALEVLSDMLLNSSFDTNELDKERNVVIEEIKMNFDLPQQRVNMLIDELLWPNQVLGNDIAGTIESVSSLTRDQLLNYFSNRYVPNNTVLSVAGNIEHAQLIANLNKVLTGWAATETTKHYEIDDIQSSPRLRVETTSGVQTHLCLAVHGFSYFHPQRFVLNLLNTVLGGGMSSRLFNEIREHRGLAYEISSYTTSRHNSGALIVYAGVDPNNVKVTTEAILEELSKLKHSITTDELKRAKELSKGRLELRLEDSGNVALWLGSQQLLRDQILEINEIIKIIDDITLDDLKQVACELLSSDKVCMAIVGPETDNPSIEYLKSTVI